jgi:hypothetical protein
MWISYCCRQGPRAGSLKKNKKRRRRFGVGLNEGVKETSLWSRQKFLRKISPVHAHAQPYNPMNLVLSVLSVVRGSCARQPSGVLLCVFPPIATWMQISLLHDPSCSWQCASSSYLHHACASVFVRVSPGLKSFLHFYGTLQISAALLVCSVTLRSVILFIREQKTLKLFPIDHLHSVGGFERALEESGWSNVSEFFAQ